MGSEVILGGLLTVARIYMGGRLLRTELRTELRIDEPTFY